MCDYFRDHLSVSILYVFITLCTCWGATEKREYSEGSRGQRPSLNYAVNRMSEESLGNMRPKNEHISGSESPQGAHASVLMLGGHPINKDPY